MTITETQAHDEVPTWTLGERLTKAREHAGISIDEMATRLGVSSKTIRNYENEAVRITRSTAIAYSAETLVPLTWFGDGAGLRSRWFSGADPPNQLRLCGWRDLEAADAR